MPRHENVKIESDPVWLADKPNYSTTAQADALYWTKTGNQTGLLGVKSGSFSLSTSGTIASGVNTITGNNGNNAFTLLNLTNTYSASAGQVGSTADIIFNMSISDDGAPIPISAAKISAYKVGAYILGNTATYKAGLKFFVANSSTVPSLAMTIGETGLVTFAGALTSASGTNLPITGGVTITAGSTTINLGTSQGMSCSQNINTTTGYTVNSSAGSNGSFMRSNGSRFVVSTLILPDSATDGYSAYCSSTNNLGFNSSITQTSAGLLTVTGSTPAGGLALTSKLIITGVIGDAASSYVGSVVTLVTGNGGSNAVTGGAAGTMALNTGAGGSVAPVGTTRTGGQGGLFTSSLGNGANASGGTTNIGGAGGSYTWTAGDGGTGSTTNGVGGSHTWTAGISTTTSLNGEFIWKSGATELIRLTYDGNLKLRTSAGTKIGTATNELLAFWNASPVVQPTHIADPTGGSVVDVEARAAIASINAMLASTGLTAAA